NNNNNNNNSSINNRNEIEENEKYLKEIFKIDLNKKNLIISDLQKLVQKLETDLKAVKYQNRSLRIDKTNIEHSYDTLKLQLNKSQANERVKKTIYKIYNTNTEIMN